MEDTPIVAKSQKQEILDLKLIPFLDPRLNTRPTEYSFDAPNQIPATVLADAMFEKMQKLGGVGLSANQLGLDHRMFVMGLPSQDFRKNVFNPKIVGASKETELFEEGCLSFPNFFLTLKRPASIAVTYQESSGETVVEELSGMPARIFLHEYDHMEGFNFTHHASRFKLERASLRLRNLNRKMQRDYIKRLIANSRKPTGLPDAE